MARRKASPDAETDADAPAAGTAEYTVLARRYRPRQFEELVGQEAVARALRNALASGRVAHAYLFTGARGVGKTSTARILAKCLNCVQGPTANPCDTCDICQAIAVGEDVDVLEIDAASNTGVDNIREIRVNVQSRPARARYKIYIIDEVHMLSRGAFNALLKTLEEPPEHVKFIFATTEVEKIPVTILSRCQRFDFPGIGSTRIVTRLREIVAAEGMQADADALELIARRAGGSMRDAQSLLDQLLAFGGDHLTSTQVHGLLGTAQDERVLALADAIFSHETAQALHIVGQAADEGLQLGELLDQLLEYWRDLMIVQCAGVEGQTLSVAPAHRQRLAEQAKKARIDTILAGLDVLASTKARLRNSGQGRVLLEMAVVRLSRLEDLVPLTQLAQWVSQGKLTSSSPPARAATQASPPEAQKKNPPVRPEPQAGPEEMTNANLGDLWPRIRALTGPMLGSHLERAGEPAISGPNTLVLRFPGGYNSDRDYCQQSSSVARLEEALKRVTGQNWNIRVESATVVEETAPAASEPEEAGSQSRYRRQRAEAVQEPLIKRAIDVLGAQIVRVDDYAGSPSQAAQERTDAAEGEES